MRQIFLLSLLVLMTSVAFSQGKALPFKEAVDMGVGPSYLDSLYKSAVHADSTQAVFRTTEQQAALIEAYTKLLQDFGRFLTANDFLWEKRTRSFNRVYFSKEGKIDYFLYQFNGSEEDKPSPEMQERFKNLLNNFISDYQLDMQAEEGFAQCSPTVYQPK